MNTRRSFLKNAAQYGLVGATSPLWSRSLIGRALAQAPSNGYKAIVVIALPGGNDANNMLIPTESASFAQYTALRGCLALPMSSLNLLNGQSPQGSFALHPSLVNVSRLYNQQRAAVICNVGPLVVPSTKAGILSGSTPSPDSLLSHTNAIQEWDTASAFASTVTGWGGRLADQIANMSGSLPPVLNTGSQAYFTVGQTVQGIALQGGGPFPALPVNCQSAINDLANLDAKSSNRIVAEAAKVRQASLSQQALLFQAASYQTLKTPFAPGFSQTMKVIAQTIAGRSVIGASRQIFFAQQGFYDTHNAQLGQHANCLSDLDQALGSFFDAMDELGLGDQVLVCTHSDFNRSFTSNTEGGSDHGWGTHQLILGGGIKGGRLLGTFPTLDLNGPDDVHGQGVWVPTTASVQMASGIGTWMGLTPSQLGTVYPELKNFPAGALALT